MLKHVRTTLAIAGAALLSTGCLFPGKINLAQVASDSGLKNVTTGDGNYDNYTATGYHKVTELGIGVGLPFVGTFFELYPASTPEQTLTEIAKAAAEDGANGMINVHPEVDFFTGFPFFIVGVYVQGTDGTGIKSN